MFKKNILIILLFCASCAKVPYQYHEAVVEESPKIETDDKDKPAPEAQIERGEPYSFLDNTASWTIGVIPKLILWNVNMDAHEISPQTEEAIRVYLTKNNMPNVKVRFNQYAPGDEWCRLWNNDSVGIGWRATIGVIANLFYTLLPGRFFGGDNYNPYTNSINIYSDHPAVALHEGGHAKDLAGKEWKGTYAFFSGLPLISLYSEAEATGDAIGYLKDNQCREKEEGSYKVLYPAYATYIGGEFSSLLCPGNMVGMIVALAPVIPAHIVGRIKASDVNTAEDICEQKK